MICTKNIKTSRLFQMAQVRIISLFYIILLVAIFHAIKKGFSMKRCLITVLIQNLRTLMGSFKRKICYASRLKKGTIKRLKFSIKKLSQYLFVTKNSDKNGKSLLTECLFALVSPINKCCFF